MYKSYGELSTAVYEKKQNQLAVPLMVTFHITSHAYNMSLHRF